MCSWENRITDRNLSSSSTLGRDTLLESYGPLWPLMSNNTRLESGRILTFQKQEDDISCVMSALLIVQIGLFSAVSNYCGNWLSSMFLGGALSILTLIKA